MTRLEAWIRNAKQPYHWVKAVIANLLYGFPSRGLTMIMVTGTDGKTTTSTLMYSLLKKAGKHVTLISTVAAYIGDQEIDTGFHVTSPSPFALQRFLRTIKKKGGTFVVLETTSHGIFQHRVLGPRPTFAILTNVTREHLDYHTSFGEYLNTKASLLARAKYALVNKNDKSTKTVKERLRTSNCVVVEYNFSTLRPNIKKAITARFPERYNWENAAAAVMVAEHLHLPERVMVEAIRSFSGVPGRMQHIPNKKGIIAIVDFAHTPNALEQALRALRSQVPPGKKLIAVFGTAHKRDRSKRPIMGRIASELADEVVVTAEDPRGANVWTIIREIKSGVKKNIGHMHGIADRREAIRFAVRSLANPGDIVGVFGKGHEKSMNIDGKRELPWSDEQELIQALT